MLSAQVLAHTTDTVKFADADIQRYIEIEKEITLWEQVASSKQPEPM